MRDQFCLDAFLLFKVEIYNFETLPELLGFLSQEKRHTPKSATFPMQFLTNYPVIGFCSYRITFTFYINSFTALEKVNMHVTENPVRNRYLKMSPSPHK